MILLYSQKKVKMQKILLLLFISPLLLFSQEIQKCATDHYIQHLETKNPGTIDRMQQVFEIAKQRANAQNFTKNNQQEWDTIYRIPVVFHVVYNTPQQNISDELILSQLEILNRDFRRINEDTANTRAIFKERAIDAGIEFHLATIDPQGSPTTGITRTITDETSFELDFFNPDAIDNIKDSITGGKNAWDTDKYLNIWIGNLGNALLGFAYPPEAAPNWPEDMTADNPDVWGVVLNHRVVGEGNSLALPDADEGRAAVHEVGHYLGLRHIWGDGPLAILGVPDCDADDGIDDTPNAGTNSQGACDFNKNTCPDDPEPDMVENYMDYSTEACQNSFTRGQVEIMRSMLVIGRPFLAKIIKDEIFTASLGEFIVVNNTDTFFVDATTVININEGDEVMFLNENNGFNYTATQSFSLFEGDEAFVTEEGTIFKDALSINDFNALNLSIYPNPTQNTFFIEGLNESEIEEIVLYDIQGKTIDAFTINNLNSLEINTPNLSNGLYILGFYQSGQLVYSEKVGIAK